jgi:hypothetical protein
MERSPIARTYEDCFHFVCPKISSRKIASISCASSMSKENGIPWTTNEFVLSVITLFPADRLKLCGSQTVNTHCDARPRDVPQISVTGSYASYLRRATKLVVRPLQLRSTASMRSLATLRMKGAHAVDLVNSPRKPRSQSAARVEPKFFRCPACGENVDASDSRNVIEHHRHVLYPALYPYIRKTA